MSWKMNLINQVNQVVPSFTDIFDEETFYLTAFLFVIGSFLVAFKSCIEHFVSFKDVIVQAPTGSGKTLAYVLPVLEILLKEKPEWKKSEIGAVILVPSQELAVQVEKVFSYFLNVTKLRTVIFSGKKNVKKDVKKFCKDGGNIIIATPGRLETLLNLNSENGDFNLKVQFKMVEVFVLDEADRLLELGFSKSLTKIMSHLPKTRRTGLFSATIPKNMAELIKIGMRNPMLIVIDGHKLLLSEEAMLEKPMENDQQTMSTPHGLKIYYSIVAPEAKLAVLRKFLLDHLNEKILIFFSTCRCVDYFGEFLKKIFKKKTKILTIHGKKQNGRQRIFNQFLKMKSGILVATDLMTRGIDVADIDWVVQFDPPRQASWFIHRCGRTARVERSGNALILLMPNEESYPEFLKKNQSVNLSELSLPCSTEDCDKMLEVLRERALSSREILEAGTKAFVSYIQSYCKHDCYIVCSLKSYAENLSLDVVNVAHCYGLLKLPRMPELAGRDLSQFKRSSVNTSTIAYKDSKKEEKRLQLMEQRRKSNDNKQNSRQAKATGKGAKRKQKISGHQYTAEEVGEIEDDYKMVKKLKTGKISREDFDQHFASD
ncbi:ATP-dependent RNA helicase DDX55 [Trichinella pseudospiralis]|uniref:ATP-dependent RNA helicase n=1 Tax=Trichinella pseudospiralis TaxID=6337 RepID=A0A0V1K7L8_TRIPS|nr:ATP-dependent RNA helicase DDX55 [Trichinella pseudospiralis]KRZ43204.1 ATP-dependent RNA helicase DDX55 [Trichinella pseudospiralis]